MSSGTTSAQVYLTKNAALEQYFSGSSVERRTLFLTNEQVSAIQTAAKARVPSRVVTYYVGKNANGTSGYAFFDTHVVRTMPATIMIVVNPDSTVRAVEVLAFYEPEDYRPPARWLHLFDGKTLRSDLWLKRGIQNIVGATLSAQSITDAVRLTLALYQTAVPKE
ncbi:MAG: FMN-binding protein [Ignavibacteriales bacterium]|nr:FMN-binding protein [Ignavibacteriales bacterium]